MPPHPPLRGTFPPEGGREGKPLPLLERWKLLDNLRRSLVPPALLTLLVLGWTVLPGLPGLWTAMALAVFALPFFQMALGVAIGCVRSRSLTPLKKAWERLPSTFGQVGLELVFLAYRAVLLLDAIVRTLVRLLVTHRKLLEWETAASTEQRLGTGLAHFAAVMWPAPALAIAIAVAIVALRPGAIAVAAPFLVAWLLSPYMAFRVSLPRPVVRLHLTGPERTALRRVARKTWLFFETFVTDADHWLPPDNFQEIPDGRLAHRTSPTNQGLLLLSTLAANDLGYIGPGTLADRLERTFNTLDGLEKHWGHFYNWYETQTLQPLPPRYISTVDSGNLLGCLLTLAWPEGEGRGARFRAVGDPGAHRYARPGRRAGIGRGRPTALGPDRGTAGRPGRVGYLAGGVRAHRPRAGRPRGGGVGRPAPGAVGRPAPGAVNHRADGRAGDRVDDRRAGDVGGSPGEAGR